MGYRLLTLVGLLVAVAMLGQGLAQGGYIAGRDEWLDPEVATVLLIAGGAMLIAVMTLRAFPGMAAVEMGLTGIVALVGFAFVNPVQRSLAATAPSPWCWPSRPWFSRSEPPPLRARMPTPSSSSHDLDASAVLVHWKGATMQRLTITIMAVVLAFSASTTRARDAWVELIGAAAEEHCAIRGYHRGYENLSGNVTAMLIRRPC